MITTLSHTSNPLMATGAAKTGANSQLRVKAVTGQTLGPLIDLHYVKYSGDVERGK